ncbi:endonuclease/exonuclease/phosphatase family protein [Lutimonas zeaxanthinifaciens]|uniref:endonuclease/exonuclease/phosphatase family protein n=1 Tax=Lutimonas zeaxanthinifaciens TaxID=3060215 RepID=UPI00265D16C4|nr:endonuclease/exonuclease/phosphatase family protein [Lutimonas sp. YSD2104]WKK64799.1 endonuclease/exonuclease/phosphatase family protein [Lutimonas sp. YSD2104]
MKNLSFLNKIMFFLNNIAALIFFAALFIPYIAPKTFPLLSIISLMVPFVLFAHILFIIYWILSGFKKQFLLSAICILLAVGLSLFPYKFKSKEVISGNSFGVMNYNVRLFNKYQWIQKENVAEHISKFIQGQAADVICFQEFTKDRALNLNYPYVYEKLNGGRKGSGLAIYSKYRIVNKGSLDFEHSFNNAIFVDILRNNDTLRIYNVHLESFGIKPDSVDLNLNETRSKKLIYRLKKSFTKQQEQVEKFLDHKENCPYKTIISGDFNNTAYSWAYRMLKSNLNDTFIESGKGFGKTYSFNKYPLRIDFILTDSRLKVNQHKNFNLELSDHEPVLAKLSY